MVNQGVAAGDRITLQEGAFLLGITRARAIQLISTGAIIGVYDGSQPMNSGRWFFSRAAVQRERDERRVTAAPAENRSARSAAPAAIGA